MTTSSLHDKLTILIQTSPIPSHPSTALLEALFRSFHKADGLLESRIVILADGVEEIIENKKDISLDEQQQQQLLLPLEVENIKHGKASSETAENYREHLKRLRRAVQDQNPPFQPHNGGSIELYELETRHGSAPGIHFAMEKIVETPLVMVCQHDNFFINETPFRDVVTAMSEEPFGLGIGANCIHFLSTATMNYQDKIKRRYNLDLPPVKVKGLNYDLVPLAFWYGRSHLTYSSYVREYVLNRPLAKGSHLEELLGEKQLHDILSKRCISNEDAIKAHRQYGTYVLDQKIEVLYHLSGRRARQAADNHHQQTTLGEITLRDCTKSQGQKFQPLASSFTTARSCRAVVPGLVLTMTDEKTTNPSSKKFKQKCFRCGMKGHSKKFCPQKDPQEEQEVEIINLT